MQYVIRYETGGIQIWTLIKVGSKPGAVHKLVPALRRGNISMRLNRAGRIGNKKRASVKKLL